MATDIDGEMRNTKLVSSRRRHLRFIVSANTGPSMTLRNEMRDTKYRYDSGVRCTLI